MEAEKNDVDVNRLFTWGRVFEVVNPKTKEVSALVYMRLLGDADVNRARVYALRKSAEMRRKLIDETSDEFTVIIKDIKELEVKDITNYIVMFSIREISTEARRNVSVKLPTPPKSNAPLAKMEKYQLEVDAYHTKVQDAVEKYIKKEVDKLLKSLEGISKEDLYKRYQKLLVEEFCEREALKAYNDMEIFLGCHRDDNYTEKFFKSFDEYDNLDSSIKAEFQAAYSSIQMTTDELKKLREATQ